MSCSVRTVVFFILFVNICIGRRWNEYPLSRHLRNQRNDIRDTKNEAAVNVTRPTDCLLSKVQNLTSSYIVEYPLVNYSADADSRVLSTISNCDYVMIFVKEQQRSRLELNGHDITDKLHFDQDSVSCYNAIFNSNEYYLRRGDATCSLSLRIVTGYPIINIVYLLRH